MKKIVIAILGIFLFSTSCEEYIDLNNPNAISSEEFFTEPDHAVQAITACYSVMEHAYMFGLNYHFLYSAFSDRGIHENSKWNEGTYNSTDPYIADIYVKSFQGIYRCNLALEKIPQIEMDKELQDRLLGEAFFLRAYYYFLLTISYNEPPLLRERENDFNATVKNASKEEIYNSIKSDFKRAIELLPEEYDAADKGRATKGAALGFLGKTYLYQSSHLPDQAAWDSAKYCFQEVQKIADKGIYGLMEPLSNDSIDFVYSYLCNFSPDDLKTKSGNVYKAENNKESLFEVQFSSHGFYKYEGGHETNGSSMSQYFGSFGFKNLAPTAEFAENAFEQPTSHPSNIHYDPRRYGTVFVEGDTIDWSEESIPFAPSADPIPFDPKIHANGSIAEGYAWKKYFYPAHVGSWGYYVDPNNIRLLRYSDILLMLCEAEYHLNGSSSLALESINKVRARAGMPLLSEVTPEAIIHERDVEFGFECSRFHDLVRWSLLPSPWIDINEYLPLFVKGKHEYLPIPIREINLMNGDLKQNPGW